MYLLVPFSGALLLIRLIPEYKYYNNFPFSLWGFEKGFFLSYYLSFTTVSLDCLHGGDYKLSRYIQISWLTEQSFFEKYSRKNNTSYIKHN